MGFPNLQHNGIDPYLGVEGAKADLLGPLDQASIRILPGDRNGRLFVCVYD
jgi:hypothetical protein